MQYGGRLWISTITLSDLYTWAYKQNDPAIILDKVRDFLLDVQVLPFDEQCARTRQVARDRFSSSDIRKP
jgi:predicted nucleic acid-binding protein